MTISNKDMKILSAFVILSLLITSILFASYSDPIFAQKKAKNNDDDDKKKEKDKDKLILKVKVFLQGLERTGFLRITSLLNGQEVVKDIPFSEINPSQNTIKIDLKVDKKTDIIQASSNDEYHVCVYHVKDLQKGYGDSFTKFDCNEGDILSVKSPNTVSLFKPSSQVLAKSLGFQDRILVEENPNESAYFYDEEDEHSINDTNNNNNDDDNKAILKIYAPLADKKDTKKLKIMAMIKGQIQSAVIDDVREELKKTDGSTISRTFVFDRQTDIGLIQLGDRFLACVASDDLRPPEGQECEKRLLKKFGKPNGLAAR